MPFADLKETSFIPAPPGSHPARLIMAVDLGTQDGHYGPKRQILMVWELSATKMEDGRPFTVSEWYTASLSRKSNLRRDVEGWLGRPLTQEEVADFSPTTIADTPCLLSIIQKKSQSGVLRAYVQSISPLPAGMPALERINDLLIFDLINPDREVFHKLPESIQERIKQSPEWKRGPNSGGDDDLDTVA